MFALSADNKLHWQRNTLEVHTDKRQDVCSVELTFGLRLLNNTAVLRIKLPSLSYVTKMLFD